MAQTTFSITKRAPFRNSTQEWSNVYTYGSVVAPNESEVLARIDELTAFEKTIHANNTTFLHGRGWSSGGSISSNIMIGEKDLSGVGALTVNVNCDVERAYLFMWPCGFDSRGHQIYLRKWYHSCAAIPGSTLSTGILNNSSGFTSTERTAIASTVNAIRRIGGADEYLLKSMAGRDSTADCTAHQFFEHHQLGDQWRAG